jgi:hypothetical protein
MVFLEIFLIGFSGIRHPAAPSTVIDRCMLWKTDYCWSRMFNVQRSWDLRWAFSPSTCIAFRSSPSNLHQPEVQWWISSVILQTSCLEDVNLRITWFRLCKIKATEGFSVYGSRLLELEAEVLQIQQLRISLCYLISVDQQDLVLGGFMFLYFEPLVDFSLVSYCFGF